jgi:carboxypeptidase C (cathepsin A)
VNTPYQLALPSYAATAWYHHKLPDNPPDLDALMTDVEHFAMGEYAHALGEGAALSDAERDAVAEKLHQYTGLPVAYIKKANLRIDGGMFEKTLLADQELTIGRLDTRYTSPTLDPLSKESEYDPQSAALNSAYVSIYNDYARTTLGFPKDAKYKPSATDIGNSWDYKHKQPGAPMADPIGLNVMPDLATAMKTNPRLKVVQFGGYYDLATPYFAAEYEMRHLGLPRALRGNIEFHHFDAGHMVYVSPEALKKLHDDVVAFIRAESK